MYLKFAELPVDDVDRAIAFYSGKLRLTLITDAYAPEGGRWVEFAMPEGHTSLLIVKRRAPADRDRPALVLLVPDVEATYQRLHALGVEFVNPPAMPVGSAASHYATFRDSEGNLVMIESD